MIPSCPILIKPYFLESDQSKSKRISEEAVTDREVILHHLEYLKNEKNFLLKENGLIQRSKYSFRQLLNGANTRIKKLLRIQIEDNTNLAHIEKDAAAVERKLKRQITLLK